MFINKRVALVAITVFVLIFPVTNFSYSEVQNKEENIVYTKEFGVFSGWASGDLKEQDDYEMIPLYLQFGFDITNALHKINIKPKGNLKFILEPFLNTVVSPNSNIELGNNFILKYSHPITKRIFMYLEGGLGLLYMSQHTREQSTHFNFSEQIGVGFSYFFSKNKAINMGYRYRHLSNAGIDEPNSGIDMDYFLCGMTILY